MSLSVETVMHNYRVKIAYIKRNIFFIDENARNLLAQLAVIDADSANCAELQLIIAQLRSIMSKIENNSLLKQIEGTQHVDLELAKRVSNFLHRQLEDASSLQDRINEMKEIVVTHEMQNRLETIKKHLKQKEQWKVEDFVEKLEDKNLIAFIQEDIQKNMAELQLYSKRQVAGYVDRLMQEFYESVSYQQHAFALEWTKQIANETTLKDTLLKKIDEFSKRRFNDRSELRRASSIMQTQINEMMMDESARKTAITSIIKAITTRGFIVSPNEVRLVEENDERVVIVVAKKVTGELAVFKVYLDGRFVYKFDNYQGHAHDTDEQPFVDALALYDVALAKEQKKQYDNPDRIMKDAKKTMDVKTSKK